MTQESLLKRITLICVLMVILLSGLALFGWVSNSLIFASFRQNFIPMAPSTALMFMAAGVALLVYRYTAKSPFAKIFAFAVVFLILSVCVLILIRSLSGKGYDVELWFPFHPLLTKLTFLNSHIPIGRMSPLTAANFLLVAISLFLIAGFRNKRRAREAAAVLLVFVILFVSVMMISYLYRASLLFSGDIIPMALTTGMTFFFLGIGLIVAAGADVQPLSLFLGVSIRARLIRAFSPLIFIVILFYGWYDTAVSRHVGNETLALAVFVILCSVLVNMLISEKSKVISREIEKAETDRRHAEDALGYSEAKYRVIVDSALVGVYQSRADGEVIFVNSSVLSMLGYDSVEDVNLHGGAPVLYKNPQDRQELIKIIKQKGRIDNYELEFVTKTGKLKNILMNMRLDMDIVSGTMVDITERKKAEEDLIESEARFRELFDNMSDCVAVYEAVDNGGDFIFRDFNKAAEKLENVKREEIMGRRVTEVFPGVKEFGIFDVFKRVFATEKPEHYSINFYRDEKISGWRDNYVYKLPTGEVVAVYVDVTKRKEAEEKEKEFVKEKAKAEVERAKAEELRVAYEELKKLEVQLIQAEKLASIGQLAASVAHELNSPLDGLMSLLRLYRKNVDEGSSAHKELTVMLGAVEYMAGIVRQLVSFARESKGEFVELHFNDIINNTLVFVSALLAEKGIIIKKDLDPNLSKIKGEKNQLQQVVLNLVNNSCGASPCGSEVIIRTRNSDDGGSVIAEFIDNGIGIRTEDLPKIFDLFFTTKDTGKGVGLGLFISQGIIKQHNADMVVDSQWGHGTKVTITFPTVK